MLEIITFSASFLFTYFGVWAIRRWSLQRKFVVVPNERSLHSVPTPHGGGLVIVLVCLSFYVVLSIFIFQDFSWSYFLGAILVASISWLDDLYSVPVIWRFLFHTIAAGLVVYSLGYFREIYIPFGNYLNVGFFGAVLTFFWIVWLTNAYNFMDGIDGLAGLQAVTAGSGWFIVCKMLGIELNGLYSGVLAAAGLGFLMHNWQPAKIFMGDVGSAFLGFSFAVLPLLTIKEKADSQLVLLIAAVIFVWLFLWDTVLTFFRRILQKEKIWQAHRGHIYQKLIIAGYSHQYITCLYGGLSFLTGVFFLLWMFYKTGFGFILLLFVIAESIGLLLFLKFAENGRIEQK